jgi:ribose transport system substrate-binding protein
MLGTREDAGPIRGPSGRRAMCRFRARASAAVLAAFVASAANCAPVSVEEAQAIVTQASSPSTNWTGPVSGPRAQPGKSIAILAEDLRNGGVLGVAQGIREAAHEIGWQVRVFDSGGSAAGRLRAVREALSSQPDGLVLCGSDARERERDLRAASTKLPPIVAWHAGPSPGPLEGTSVAMNVTTDPIAVARTAALVAVAQSRGRAGVVIFTDSRFAIATTKARAMADVIHQCSGCTLLALRDVPISQSAEQAPAVIRSLLAEHGSRWTHALAINDIYYDHAVAVLLGAGLPNDAISMISAGDGSAPAFARVQAGVFQTATVAEPLNLQGWQLVDELNRLFAGQSVSGFVAPVHLVTRQNIDHDGGRRHTYDPDNGYRDIYRRIWHP